MAWRNGLMTLSVIVCAMFALVAQGGTGPRNRGPAAFIWDADNGMRDLTDLLIDDYGIDLGGSILTSANGISADGTVMWGEKAFNSDGTRYWMLTLDGNTADYRPLVELQDDLPGSFLSQFTISTMSRDGSVLGGYTREVAGASPEAIVWSKDTGVVKLGRLLDGALSDVSALSFDGSVAVGRAGTPQIHGFRWTSDTGMEDLGELPGGGNFSWARAISYDGAVIVGDSSSANSGTSLTRSEAFRWTEETGMVGLGGGINGIADVISGDGRVIGGATNDDGIALYTDGVGWQTLDDPNAVIGRITSISFDGSFVVGNGLFGRGPEAYLWSEEQGFLPLGDLPGDTFSSTALGLSDDGQVVVGRVQVPEPTALAILVICGVAGCRRTFSHG